MNRFNTIDLFKGGRKSIPFFRNFNQKEISLLFIVGIIGCLGTLFIFTKAWIINSQETSQNLDTITIYNSISPNFTEKSHLPFLSLNGKLEPQNSIGFNITNFNPKATYEVDFGDGTILEFQQQEFNYTYKNEGNYQVKLTMHYKEKSTPIFETSLQISQNNKSSLLSGI